MQNAWSANQLSPELGPERSSGPNSCGFNAAQSSWGRYPTLTTGAALTPLNHPGARRRTSELFLTGAGRDTNLKAPLLGVPGTGARRPRATRGAPNSPWPYLAPQTHRMVALLPARALRRLRQRQIRTRLGWRQPQRRVLPALDAHSRHSPPPRLDQSPQPRIQVTEPSFSAESPGGGPPYTTHRPPPLRAAASS